MFSLSYLPTAERLTVVVVKARNLRWTHTKETAGEFVPGDDLRVRRDMTLDINLLDGKHDFCAW